MPQPIDMQTELGRATMAERIQDASTRAAMIAQQRAQDEEQKASRVQETQISETPEAQNEHVDADGRRHGDARRGGSEPSTKSKQSSTGQTRSARETDDHTFDVSI